MPEEYVRREVFESEIRRTDEKIDNAVARMEAKVDAYTARVEGALAEMRGEMQGALGEMRGEIKAINTKLGNLVWTMTLSVAIMGLLLTGVTIGVTVYLSMH